MAVNFNSIAPFYDFLVRVAFGKELWKAQEHYLNRISKDDKILVLGGGTGHILDWIPNGCDITFLDQSERMLARAMNRREVNFIHQDFLKFDTTEKFDWIICPFFLDCFSEGYLTHVFDKIRSLLAHDGKLNVTDFYPQENVWAKTKLWGMHLFFRVFARLDSRKLQNIREAILANGFTCDSETKQTNHGIFSAVYTLTTGL